MYAEKRLDASVAEILTWLSAHKYRVSQPVDIHFHVPSEHRDFECAHVLLKSGNHVMVRRVGPVDLDATILWVHSKYS